MALLHPLFLIPAGLGQYLGLRGPLPADRAQKPALGRLCPSEDKNLFLEAPSELAIWKLEKELEDKLIFYLNRVVQTGGGFAIKNCQGEIAAILKQRLLERRASPDLLAVDFEEKLGEIMAETGDRMESALAGNPAFKKAKK